MRGQRLLIVTLGVAILVSLCSSIEPNSTDTSPTESKVGKINKANLKERLSEMAKEFGATSFEETSEEMASGEEETTPISLAPKQHVKRLVSAEQAGVQLQEYQGVMGRPGVDFPVLPSIPKTSFSCRQVKSSGYYADLDTDCQVFHICADGRKISFLCPNGTIFRQSHLICDWWWTVDCASSKEHYEESAEMLANDRKIYQARSDALSKSRARQRSNRKPGLIREFDGASASIASVTAEPNPRNARIQAHSKVINTNKQFPSSTAKPDENSFSNAGFSRSSDEYQAAGSMAQAEQRQIHAFHPPFPETRARRPITGQLPEGRQASQSRQLSESTQSPHNIPQLRNFKQNIPPAQGAPERQLAPSRDFLDIQPPPRPNSLPRQTPLSRQPLVTTHRPQINQFSNVRQFEQNIPERQFLQGRQTSQSRFSPTREQQQQQIQETDDLRPPSPPPPSPSQNNQRQPQFRPQHPILAEDRETNGTKTYTHFRTFSPSDGERQLPAETGSFVNNRGSQLNSLQQSTPRPSKQRITPVPQNRVPQGSSKSYVELDRSRTTTPKPTEKPLKVALSQRVKPIVVQVTDRGLTGLSKKDKTEQEEGERATQEPPFDDDDEGDDGFPEPPSEEQFKDEDLFYLRGTTESDIEDAVSSTVTPEQQNEEEVDLDLELGLSKPPSEVQFKDEDLRGSREESKSVEDHNSDGPIEPSSIPERSTAPSIKEEVSRQSDSELTSLDISTTKMHRFRTPTTSTTPTPGTSESESISHILISSTLEPPTWKAFSDEDVVIIKESMKITKKPFMVDEEEGDGDKSAVRMTTTTTTEDDTKATVVKDRSLSPSPVSIVTTTSASTTSVEPTAKRRVTPIFLEIISRGSSEPPILKTFTVEELEKKHEMTESSVSADKSPSTSVPSSPVISTRGRLRSRTSTGTAETSTTREFSTPSTTAIPSSSLTLSKRVHPPKQDITQTTPKPNSDKIIKSTTSIPPTTLYVTLSRRVQPPVLILSSTDPREKSKSKKDETAPRIKESFRTRTRTTTEGTTPVTISRRVRPPLVEVSTNVSPVSTTSSSITGTAAKSREFSESAVSLQTVTASSVQSLNIEADQLPLEEDSADDLLRMTESLHSSSSSTRKSTTYVEIQRRKSTTLSSTTATNITFPTTTEDMFTKKSKLTTTTAPTPSTLTTHASITTVTTTEVPTLDNSSSNRPLEIGNSIREAVTIDPELPKSLPLQQEPTPAPQFGNRDGLDIPASSGPSTLHSLAVYFASKDSQTETTSPAFDSSTQFDSKKRRGKDKTSTVSTPLASTTEQPELSSDKSVTDSNDNGTDTSVGALNFLTQSTRDSYSSLFPNTKTESSSTTEQTITTVDFAQRILDRTKNKDRKASESTSNTLRSELLNKLAEISQMESTTPTEEKTTVPERPVYHTDTEDLLQGTDSRDLRELAQIFSRALSAYLEDPEEFKRVLNEVRPKEPGNYSTLEEIQHQSTTLQPIISSSSTQITSSAEYSSSVLDDEEEVLDFSDVSKVSRKKTKSTTPLPLLSKNLKQSKRKGLTSSTSQPSSSTFVPSASPLNYPTDKDIDDSELTPPKERLENAQTNYYTASRPQISSGRGRNGVQGEIETSSSPTEVTSADYSLPPGSKQYTGPGYGPQAAEKFAPTAGGVNDPSRPRYGGFQNNSILSRKVSETGTQTIVVKVPDNKKIIEATTLNPVSRTQSKIATKPRPASNTTDGVINKVKGVTDTIGGILNTFVPEEVNNLAEVGGTVESQTDNQYNKNNSRNSKSDESLIGANTASFSSSRARESSNQVKSTKKWNNAAQGVDPLTINRELSASEVVESTTAGSTEQSKTKSRNKVKSRNRSSSSSPSLSSEDIKLSTDSLSTTSSPVSLASVKTTRSPQEIKTTAPTLSIKTENLDQYDDEQSDSEEELKSSVIPDITFYSEKIKPPPPPSASLVRTSSRKANTISPSSTTSLPSSETITVNTTVNRNSENNSTSSPTLKPTATQSTTTLPLSTTRSQKKASRTSDSKGSSNINERNSTSSQLLTDSVEIVKDTSKEDPIQTVTWSRISTPMPFAETTLIEKQHRTKSTTTPPKQASSDTARPSAKTVAKSSEPSSVTPTETTKRRKTTTTQLPLSDEEGDEIELLKEDQLKKDVAISQIVSDTTRNPQPKTTAENRQSTIKNNPKSTLQNSRLSQDRTTQTSTEFVTNISTKPPPSQMFAKVRMSSDSSEISRLTASSEMNLSIEDVTSEQLQALEDLQTMLFPANATMSEDGTMFGNLNQSSTLSLINTMKEAVTNSTVRRLVLLLVNSLKENTPEDARRQLIQALLRMPIDRSVSNTKEQSIMARLDTEQADKSSHSIGNSAPFNNVDQRKPSKPKNSQINTKTVDNKESVSQVKITTTQPPFRTRSKKPTQTTTIKEQEITTPPPSTTARSKGKRPARLRSSTETPQTTTGRTASQGGEVALEDLATEADTLPQSDTRAVELLRSLYSLASRWG